MPEESELPEEPNSGRTDVQRYVSVIRRRHVLFLAAVLFGWLVVWGASWVLPARYKSGTLILVEQPTMPKNYVEPNVNEDLQDRLQSITQQILSRTRLLLIIEKLHLYSEGHKQITPDDKVERMRKDIGIELVRGSQNDQITAFKVFYSAGDPHVAQEVTSELVEQEGKVREFEGNHEGELPSQQASNLQILSGLQAQLQNEQDALNTAKQQRVYYQTLIDQYRTLQTTITPRSAGGSSTSLHAIDQELDRLKSKLADSSSHYTDRYPDLQSLKAQIAKTEKMRADLIANPTKKDSNGKLSNGGTTADDVIDASQNSPLLQLQSQLQANQTEIASREQGISSLKARVNGYQSRLNNGPAREQELADLTRGYDQSKANYDDLLKKKNGSEMATSMEQMQQGERFRMLDPPSLPIKPYFPDRLKLCGIGLGVGLALGIVVVCGFEMMDDRLHTDREIKALLPIAIISEIPEIVNPSEERSLKRKMALGWAMSALVAATILAGSAFSYLHE